MRVFVGTPDFLELFLSVALIVSTLTSVVLYQRENAKMREVIVPIQPPKIREITEHLARSQALISAQLMMVDSAQEVLEERKAENYEGILYQQLKDDIYAGVATQPLVNYLYRNEDLVARRAGLAEPFEEHCEAEEG